MSDVDMVDTPTPAEVVPAGGEGDGRGVIVSASISSTGMTRSCEAYFSEMPEESVLAATLLEMATGVAAAQGQGVWLELQRRCAG